MPPSRVTTGDGAACAVTAASSQSGPMRSITSTTRSITRTTCTSGNPDSLQGVGQWHSVTACCEDELPFEVGARHHRIAQGIPRHLAMFFEGSNRQPGVTQRGEYLAEPMVESHGLGCRNGARAGVALLLDKHHPFALEVRVLHHQQAVWSRIAHRPEHGMPLAHEQAAAHPKQACYLSPAADAGKPTNCPDARVDEIEAMPSEQLNR